MNKKAFTLVELLAVIVILSIIAIITVPIVTKTINHSKQSTYDRQTENIERASENWFIKQSDDIDNDHMIIVTLDYLISQGYLKSNKIISPKTGEELTGCVIITNTSNQYNYQFSETECTCRDKCIKYPN